MPSTFAPDTRRKLIAAAGEVFAEHGFHKATVRGITQRAGVNVAAVNYHFRDKAELYAAVLRECHVSALQPPVPATKTAPSPEQRLRGFIACFLHRLLDPAKPRWHGALMARELAEPTAVFDQIFDEAIGPLAHELFTIVDELTGKRLHREGVMLIGCSVMGQCLFHVQDKPLIDRLTPRFKSRPPLPGQIVDHISEFSLGGIRQLVRKIR